MTKNIKINEDFEMTEIVNEFDRFKFVYAPNSIWHGSDMRYMSKETILRTASARVDDFLEWLFDKSGHIDFISQREAWEEFEAWEIDENK